MPEWVLPRLRRFYYDHEASAKIFAVGVAVLLLVGLQRATEKHSPAPTKLEAQAMRDRAEQEALQALPEALAEQRRLKEHPRKGVEVEAIDPHTPVTRIGGAAGQASFRIQYGDGFFDVEDVRHWASTADPDPIDLTSDRHSVAGGSRGSVMVGGCCEEGDARVDLVLRSGPPVTLPDAPFREVSDMDLDLRTGHLLLAADFGTQRVVVLRPGAYRMRVAGVGAEEFQQARERFRIELWPRARDGAEADGGLQVLRRTRY